MIRSLSRREKMSNARSPRGVCSTTIGTRPIGRLLAMPLVTSGRDPGPLDQEVHHPALPQREPQAVQVAALLHHAPHRRRRPPAAPGEALDLRVHVGVGGVRPSCSAMASRSSVRRTARSAPGRISSSIFL